MKNTRMGIRESGKKNKNQEGSVEVLYQKMGDRWFAFSCIDDEVFVGSILQSQISDPQTDKIESTKALG